MADKLAVADRETVGVVVVDKLADAEREAVGEDVADPEEGTPSSQQKCQEVSYAPAYVLQP